MTFFLYMTIFMVIVLLLCVLLLGLPTTKGQAGEWLVRIVLRLFAPRGAVIFNDLYFHNGHHSCQIDHLIVSPSGIFVIETKTFLGVVSGNATSPTLHRRVLGKYYSITNPVIQNEYHLRYLCENLKSIDRRSDALQSIIVYSFMTQLRLSSKPEFIGTLRSLPKMLRRNATSSLTPTECMNIVKEIRYVNRRKKKGIKKNLRSLIHNTLNYSPSSLLSLRRNKLKLK